MGANVRGDGKVRLWPIVRVQHGRTHDRNRCLCAARNYVHMRQADGTDTEGRRPMDASSSCA